MSIENKNNVYLSGTITRKSEYKNMLFLSITTGTYVKNGQKHFTSPTVVFLGELALEAGKYEKGTRVDVNAAIVTRRITDINGKSRYTQSIVATNICPSKSILNEVLGIESESKRPPANRVVICGSVYSITKSNETLVKLGIGATTVVNHSRRRATVMCSYFCDDADRVLSDIHIKDSVCAAGTIQTLRFNRDGQINQKDTIVLSELQKF